EQARRLVRYVVVDLPSGLPPFAKEVFELADEICLVCGDDLASLRNARTQLALVKGVRPNDGPPRIVVSRAVPGAPQIPPSQFERILGVEPFATLPETPAVRAAEFAGAAMAEHAPKAPLTAELRGLAARLGGFKAKEAAGARRGLFGRMLGRGS
ncbi:MAG: hypothetical protein AAF322_20135, partial [Pseudomonadota bacterium]